jgi:hypothetical protein
MWLSIEIQLGHYLGLEIKVMVFNATFNNISDIYRGRQFYWLRKLKYLDKTFSLDVLWRAIMVLIARTLNREALFSFSSCLPPLKVTEGCLPNNGVFSEFREEFGWLIDRAVLLYNTPFLKKN